MGTGPGAQIQESLKISQKETQNDPKEMLKIGNMTKKETYNIYRKIQNDLIEMLNDQREMQNDLTEMHNYGKSPQSVVKLPQ